MLSCPIRTRVHAVRIARATIEPPVSSTPNDQTPAALRPDSCSFHLPSTKRVLLNAAKMLPLHVPVPDTGFVQPTGDLPDLIDGQIGLSIRVKNGS